MNKEDDGIEVKTNNLRSTEDLLEEKYSCCSIPILNKKEKEAFAFAGITPKLEDMWRDESGLLHLIVR